MQLTTPVHIASPAFTIRHSDRVLLLGSCFADNMAERLRMALMPLTVNPFGVLYNPLSISASLRRMLDGQPFTAADLTFHNGLYHSMIHHGSFSSASQTECLERINTSLSTGRRAIMDADLLVITFGSAYVYEQNGQIVGNCHKLPATSFTRRRLTVEEIVTDWQQLLALPALLNKRVIFTVSPIRHIKDGLHDNQLSKSTLLMAVEQLCGPSRLYFPSYEIMMDELRDYRFYADDMLHPSTIAVDYIWQRFSSTFFTPEVQQAVDECTALSRDLQHRPLHPDDPACITFMQRLEQKKHAIRQKYPYAVLPKS